MRSFSILFVLLFCLSLTYGQDESRMLMYEGNEAYLSDDFKSAEDLYRKKLNESPDDVSKFNLGNALYRQGRFDESAASFQESISGLSSDQKSSAYYNLGNAQVKNEQLKEAIASYREAIKADDGNLEARENMLKTKIMLKQQEQQEQQQEQQQDPQEQDENQEQNENEEQQEQEQEEEQEDQEQEEGEEEQEQEEEQEPEESEEQQAPQEMTKEEAERLLQAIENEEKKIQEKLRRQNGNEAQPRKDW